MVVARSRQVVSGRRNFDIEYVSDQVANDLGSKIRVSDDIVATQSARRRWALQGGVREPRGSAIRRPGGVFSAAGCSAAMSEHAELEAGRAGARCAGARRAPLAHASRRCSAAELPAASRARAHQICSLGACGHSIGTGRASRLWSYRTGNDTCDSHVPIGSNS